MDHLRRGLALGSGPDEKVASDFTSVPDPSARRCGGGRAVVIVPETTKSNHGNSTSNNAFSTSYVWKSRKVFVSLPSNLQAKTKKKI